MKAVTREPGDLPQHDANPAFKGRRYASASISSGGVSRRGASASRPRLARPPRPSVSSVRPAEESHGPRHACRFAVRRRQALGPVVAFDGEKIRVAIERAGKATGEFDAAGQRNGSPARPSRCSAIASDQAPAHRADPGRRRAGADLRRSLRHRARLHRLSRAARAAAPRSPRPWSTSTPRSTNISTAPTGGSTPTPTRAIRSAA